MRIIISPAKKMRCDDSMLPRDLPAFLPHTEQLLAALQELDDVSLQKLWSCSGRIAAQNIARVRQMELRRALTPAILAYEGIQYQYMAPGVFSGGAFSYVQERLRILSGFYGLLRPFDGVTPYRLEMQARLSVGGAKDLYAFWGSSLAEQLAAETDCILNLASKEYSRCISDHLPPHVRMVTCVFGEEKNGKVIEKGTVCKMVRGEMVRYLAENQIGTAEAVKSFRGLGFRYDLPRSDETTFVFLRGTQEGQQ